MLPGVALHDEAPALSAYAPAEQPAHTVPPSPGE